MRGIQYLIIFSILSAFACEDKVVGDIERWKQEILDTERRFSNASDSLGIPAAFEMFAAEKVVLLRNDQLIVGKQSLISHFAAQKPSGDDVRLTWEPEFVDVSASGDLGYTYGYYTYFYKDSLGNPTESKGVFHTVWKRQSDGSWKFVWD
ncbi:MAG: YybH family protein [Bacteroidota bacterium]